ncbi:hypothetical protein A2U01_0062517, partial [Trifolium medium]|nr:hypothetical protein [Trifolium medium]
MREAQPPADVSSKIFNLAQGTDRMCNAQLAG